MSYLESIALITTGFCAMLAGLAWYLLWRHHITLRRLSAAEGVRQGLPKEVLDKLESQARSIRELGAEWATMYGKFDRILKAMQARDRRDGVKTAKEAPDDAGPVDQQPGDRHLALWRRAHR